MELAIEMVLAGDSAGQVGSRECSLLPRQSVGLPGGTFFLAVLVANGTPGPWATKLGESREYSAMQR